MIFQTLAALRVSDSVNPPGLPGLADPSPPPRSLPDTFSLEGHLFFFGKTLHKPGLEPCCVYIRSSPEATLEADQHPCGSRSPRAAQRLAPDRPASSHAVGL